MRTACCRAAIVGGASCTLSVKSARPGRGISAPTSPHLAKGSLNASLEALRLPFARCGDVGALMPRPGRALLTESVQEAPPTIAALQQAVRMTPGDPEAYYRLGRALFKAHRHPEAVLCYRQAV